jgi:uncharacterized protein
MISIWILFGGLMLVSWLVSSQLKSRFKKYSEIPVSNTLSGKTIAEKMLRDNGIFDVQVISVEGELTDHYNPAKKTVNLSKDVYYGNSVAAAAVAAHECGHAVQHARSYAFLQLRSALVPVVSFSSHWIQWILLAGILLIKTFPELLFAGIIMFGLTTLFAIITLPVEVDASRRALVWLNGSGITSPQAHDKAADALKWAAYTYFVAALTSLATLLYYIMIYLGARDR